MAKRSFRLMDPVSHRMIALRADMTLQVARIAATRLARRPRPLRLSYAGQVLRVKGSSLRPERQFGQVGAELIGAASARADAEAILLAAEALDAVGVEGLSIDLTLPSLVPILAGGLGLAPAAAEALVDALDQNDAGAVKQLAGRAGGHLRRLAGGGGTGAQSACRRWRARPAEGGRGRARAAGRGGRSRLRARPKLALTVDPVGASRPRISHRRQLHASSRGGRRAELGRGGRYRQRPRGEPATGFTLYMDTVLRAVPAPAKSPAPVHACRCAGTRRPALARPKAGSPSPASSPSTEAEAEARRLGCSHVMGAGRAIALKG